MSMLRKTVPLLACALMAGCSTGTIGQADRAAGAKQEDATRYLDRSKAPLAPANVSPVQVSSGVYTSGTAHRSDHGDPLPRKFEGTGPNQGVTIVRAAPISLFEIGSAITGATGIPVQMSPDVNVGLNGQPLASGPSGSGPQSLDSTTSADPNKRGQQQAGPDLSTMLAGMGLNPAQGGVGNTAGARGGQFQAVGGDRTLMKVNHTGKLSAFLDQISAYYGVTWQYTNNTIQVYRYMARTFSVHALPSAVSLTASTESGGQATGGQSSAGSSSSGSTVSSTQTSKSDVTVKIWDELTKAADAIVGSNGKVTTSISTGTITVVAPADLMARVQSYIDAQNVRLARQVAVSVQVLSVSLTDSDNASVNLQGMFSQAGKYGLTFGNAAAPTALSSTAPGLGFGILQSANSKFGTTNGVISALSEKGRVSVVTSASVTTLNGIPAPLQVVNTRNYLASVSVTSSSDSSSSSSSSSSSDQTSLTPGTVTTGFNLSLLPHVLEDGSEMLLQFGINISELVGATNGFDEFSSGGQTIQLPNVNSRNFIQQARVPNGATLVLTGYEQTNDTANKQGVGNPDFLLLGGDRNGSRQRDIIVILLTPVLLSTEAPVITAE